MKKNKIFFIGAGNMAEAIIAGIISAKIYKSADISAYDIDKKRLEYIKNKYKISISDDITSSINKSDMIILAVKPQVVKVVLEQISSSYKNQLLVSIAAGVNTKLIINYLGKNSRIIRIMPNTPALVMEGMSVLSKAGKTTKNDMNEVKKIFSCLGEVEELPEKNFDAVTALSGSGPAYIFLMAEALMEAGINQGLSKDVSLKLAVQTIVGASKMMKETNEHPAELKNKVSSPGGTTIAALYKLEKGALKALMMNAVDAAAKRSKEIEEALLKN